MSRLLETVGEAIIFSAALSVGCLVVLAIFGIVTALTGLGTPPSPGPCEEPAPQTFSQPRRVTI